MKAFQRDLNRCLRRSYSCGLVGAVLSFLAKRPIAELASRVSDQSSVEHCRSAVGGLARRRGRPQGRLRGREDTL